MEEKFLRMRAKIRERGKQLSSKAHEPTISENSVFFFKERASALFLVYQAEVLFLPFLIGNYQAGEFPGA